MSTVGTARTRARNTADTGTSAHRRENGHDSNPATRALLREIESGGLDLPFPGSGDTWLRWQTLIRLGTEDLSVYIRQHHGARDPARLGERAAHDHGRDRA